MPLAATNAAPRASRAKSSRNLAMLGHRAYVDGPDCLSEKLANQVSYGPPIFTRRHAPVSSRNSAWWWPCQVVTHPHVDVAATLQGFCVRGAYTCASSAANAPHVFDATASMAVPLHICDNMPPRRNTRRSAGVTKQSTTTPRKRSTARHAAARKQQHGEQQESEAKAPQEVPVSIEDLKHRILEVLRGRKEGATC